MRNLLATAVALAPLLVATGAAAEVVVNSTRTTPISTSNATGSGPDDIRFGSQGILNLTSGVAVTIDSSNNFRIDSGGQITMANAADGATAILVNGAQTGDIIIAGSVLITDSIENNLDTDNDGDIDGPFASGTDRYGLRLAGAGPLTGDIDVTSTGAIQVEGNESYAVSIESGLVGTFRSLGTLRTIGDNSIAFRNAGIIDGDLILHGGISAIGENAVGVAVQNDVTGRLIIQSEVVASGFRYTNRPSDTIIEGLDPDDLLIGGPAVLIAGDVTGGVVFDTTPVDADPADNDEDNDGVADNTEASANIASYGSAPAVLVGSTDRTVTLGLVGVDEDAYGFINRGSIVGNGVYDGIEANGVRFGVEGGQAVVVEGGVRNTGTIAALAQEAASTALRFADGVTADRLTNSGFITAGAASTTAVDVTAIQIDAGAVMPSFTNSGSILASAGGGVANVTAVRDLSGSLSAITNLRSIQANLSSNEDGDPVTGSMVAIDVRANTTGVTLIQDGVQADEDDDRPDADGDGVVDAMEPEIYGDILFGSGADVMDIRNGIVVGAISFGDGADSLSISGGAVVRSAIDSGDGQLDINIADGVLETRQTGVVTISNLDIGADGNLIVTLDPQGQSTSGLNVTGTATLADGAGLGVRFTSLLDATGTERFNIINAGTLNYGAIDLDGVQGNSPYMFVVEAGADVAAGDVYIDARRRTAQEADFISVEAAAYDSIYGALNASDALREVFLSQTTRDGFIDAYEQMLPDHSGGPLMSLASGVDAVTRALTGRNASAAPGQTSAWVQEINFYADKDKTDTYGFRSEGFGVAGGVERGTSNGAFGLSVAFTSSDLEDPEAEAEEVLSASLLELGLYWRAQGQHWTTWARAAAGYATFDATRQFVGGGLILKNESNWNGFTLAAAGGASYERHYGRFNIRPEIYAEYFSLSEDARTETGGGDGFDLEIDGRDGHILSTVAAVNFGYGFGSNGWVRPELRVGWRQNLSVDPGQTIARFRSGGPSFTLDPLSLEGGGPILGFRLNIGNELGMLAITGDAELLEDYVRYTLLLRASFRF